MAPVPHRQGEILVRMGVSCADTLPGPEPTSPEDLILDGLIGYSLAGVPHGRIAELIRWTGSQRAPVLALDTPSGVDTTTGAVTEPAIRADATLTLALPKQGFRAPAARTQVGELYLADIGVPPETYAGLGLAVGPLFSHQEILRLW
jgi:NAD(P)H-hydrate epimerase